MINIHNKKNVYPYVTFVCITLLWSAIAFGHGGKHKEEAATAFKVLQEATALYDKLLASGKLDPGWETGLTKVEISMDKAKEAEEFAVSFHRREGSPKTVNIFFSQAGKYIGSNFSDE